MSAAGSLPQTATQSGTANQPSAYRRSVRSAPWATTPCVALAARIGIFHSSRTSHSANRAAAVWNCVWKPSTLGTTRNSTTLTTPSPTATSVWLLPPSTRESCSSAPKSTSNPDTPVVRICPRAYRTSCARGFCFSALFLILLGFHYPQTICADSRQCPKKLDWNPGRKELQARRIGDAFAVRHKSESAGAGLAPPAAATPRTLTSWKTLTAPQ